MANSLTAIFTSLLALPDLDRNRIAELLQRNDRKPMQTTSLRMRPGTRLLIDELSGLIGISQSELLNIIVESSLRDIFLPFSQAAVSIIDRFEVLMQAHDMNPTDIAQLLASWNIRISVLQDRERTVDYLTTPLLEELAERFYVSPAWLLGNDVAPVDISQPVHQWPRTEEEFKKRIIPSEHNNNADIIFWTTVNSCPNKYKNIVGILIRKKETVSGVIYHPVVSVISEKLDRDQQNWIINALRDYGTTGTVRSVSIDAGMATALEQGKTLPVLIMRQL